VQRRLLLCGAVLAAFVLTLAFVSWHESLWHSLAAPSAKDIAELPALLPTVSATAATPTAQVAPAVAATPPVQGEPAPVPDADAVPARRDRAGHGSRTR
jgi:hypothetical protein